MNKQFQKDIHRIEINPRILCGKPVIRGTRISVEHILRMFASDIPEKEILTDFPHLTHEDILAAFYYAARLMEDFRENLDVMRRVKGILSKKPSGLAHQRAIRKEWI